MRLLLINVNAVLCMTSKIHNRLSLISNMRVSSPWVCWDDFVRQFDMHLMNKYSLHLTKDTADLFHDTYRPMLKVNITILVELYLYLLHVHETM